MRFIFAAVFSILFISPSSAISISTEVEGSFRFFKYNSDFELQRLAYRDFQDRHGGAKPSILQLDEMLVDYDWWHGHVSQKTAGWYGWSGCSGQELRW
jgi:hypothetical protein